MRTFRAGLSALVIVSAGVTAEAHAFLDRAEPRVGSSVASAPRELSLWFTQNLEAAFSSVAVSDNNGARVDQGKPQIAGNVMHVELKSLPPRNLPCAMASAVRRYAYDPGQLHFPGRQVMLAAGCAVRQGGGSFD
jgi:copper resistance protein C